MSRYRYSHISKKTFALPSYFRKKRASILASGYQDNELSYDICPPYIFCHNILFVSLWMSQSTNFVCHRLSLWSAMLLYLPSSHKKVLIWCVAIHHLSLWSAMVLYHPGCHNGASPFTTYLFGLRWYCITLAAVVHISCQLVQNILPVATILSQCPLMLP